MRTRIALAILMLSAGFAAAQEKINERLRKAIIEEEGNQKLDAAVQLYQSILKDFDEERKVAATASFHLAECYRKQGKKEEAIAAYRRVVQEFADQKQLADASRNHLSKSFGITESAVLETSAGAEEARMAELKELERRKLVTRADALEGQRALEARRRYRELLQQDIQLVMEKLKYTEERFKTGKVTEEYLISVKRELVQMQQRLAAFDAGSIQPPAATIK